MRLQLIRDEHPDLAIAYDRETRSWRASKRVGDGEDSIIFPDLRDVLDEVVKRAKADQTAEQAD
jgi:hypothetical protein